MDEPLLAKLKLIWSSANVKLEIINAETFHSLLCTMTQAMTFQEDNGAVMKKKKKSNLSNEIWP